MGVMACRNLMQKMAVKGVTKIHILYENDRFILVRFSPTAAVFFAESSLFYVSQLYQVIFLSAL